MYSYLTAATGQESGTDWLALPLRVLPGRHPDDTQGCDLMEEPRGSPPNPVAGGWIQFLAVVGLRPPSPGDLLLVSSTAWQLASEVTRCVPPASDPSSFLP